MPCSKTFTLTYVYTISITDHTPVLTRINSLVDVICVIVSVVLLNFVCNGSEIYGRELVDLRKESQWEFLNTLFSVSEAVAYMQVCCN
jgi:hypothetical protein